MTSTKTTKNLEETAAHHHKKKLHWEITRYLELIGWPKYSNPQLNVCTEAGPASFVNRLDFFIRVSLQIKIL